MIENLLLVLLFVAAVLLMYMTLKARPRRRPAPAKPDSPIFRTLLLVTPSDETFTDAVKSVLIDTWGDLPVSELASKSVADLAFEFQATFPSPQYDDTTRMKIAKTVHAILTGESAPRTKAEQPTEAEPSSARRALEELAQPSKTVSGTNTTVHGGIYSHLEVSGTNATVRDAIVLRRCSIRGTNASGRVFVAPDVPVDVAGTNADVRVVQLPWDELAARAAKLRRSA